MKEQLEQWNQINKMAINPLIKLNGICSKMAERMTRQQLTQANDMLQQGMKQVQALGQAKKVDELWNAQAQWANMLASKGMDAVQQNIDSAMECMNEISRWFEKSVSNACCAEESATEVKKK